MNFLSCIDCKANLDPETQPLGVIFLPMHRGDNSAKVVCDVCLPNRIKERESLAHVRVSWILVESINRDISMRYPMKTEVRTDYRDFKVQEYD
jgi:hypothetical protein